MRRSCGGQSSIIVRRDYCSELAQTETLINMVNGSSNSFLGSRLVKQMKRNEDLLLVCGDGLDPRYCAGNSHVASATTVVGTLDADI